MGRLTIRAGVGILSSRLVASVAQLVEQLTLNQLVVGSNPPRGTTFLCFTPGSPEAGPRFTADQGRETWGLPLM